MLNSKIKCKMKTKIYFFGAYLWSTFGWGGYTNLSAKYTFLQNSIMYGAAKRGDIWRGVRITFN
jgi:hypothetical protein